jgi:hypothetical protein
MWAQQVVAAHAAAGMTNAASTANFAFQLLICVS